jgi:hypothetical protein
LIAAAARRQHNQRDKNRDSPKPLHYASTATEKSGSMTKAKLEPKLFEKVFVDSATYDWLLK